MFLGCGTNSDKQETKSQNIIFTKEVIEEKDSQELSLLQVTVANNEKAQEIASMYESIDVCSNSNCFRTDIISDPKDTTIADIAISDFSEPLKYISYKKYDESLYDAHFYYLPKEINLTKGSTHKLYLAKDTNKNTVAFKPSLITMFSPLDKPFLYTPKIIIRTERTRLNSCKEDNSYLSAEVVWVEKIKKFDAKIRSGRFDSLNLGWAVQNEYGKNLDRFWFPCLPHIAKNKFFNIVTSYDKRSTVRFILKVIYKSTSEPDSPTEIRYIKNGQIEVWQTKKITTYL